MTEEEFFIKNYPDSCYGDKPLSPHWDFFQCGVEFGERQSEKKIEELKEELAKKSDTNHQLVQQLAEQNEKLTEAKELIENIIRVTWGEGWNYSLDWKVKAEAFLKE